MHKNAALQNHYSCEGLLVALKYLCRSRRVLMLAVHSSLLGPSLTQHHAWIIRYLIRLLTQRQVTFTGKFLHKSTHSSLLIRNLLFRTRLPASKRTRLLHRSDQTYKMLIRPLDYGTLRLAKVAVIVLS